MTKFKLFLAVLLTAALTTIPSVGAVTEEDLPDAGITPDSFFYFLDTWGESIDLAFTFSEEARVDKLLSIADEKLAEANEMAAANNVAAMEKAQSQYENKIQLAIKNAEQVQNKEQVLEKIQTKVQEQVDIMDNARQNAPEEVKGNYKALEDATEKGNSDAKDAVEKQKGGPSTDNGGGNGGSGNSGSAAGNNR